MDRLPKPGEIYKHDKDKPYQIITVATHTETGESMVVYQALYGEFKIYAKPASVFLNEVDKIKYPNVVQSNEFGSSIPAKDRTPDGISMEQPVLSMKSEISGNCVNQILLQFLDAESFSKKLEVITSNLKHMDDRLINDMAVSLDCTIEEGPLDKRIQELIYCLKAMIRFEDRRLR